MTPSSPRRKRKPPTQSGPIRNSMAPPPQSATQTAPPRDPITAAGTAVCGALENGVRTAYAVIDEYMRRGQETARGIFNNDPNRRGTMSDDRSGFPGGFNPSNPMAMFTEQWMTAMRAWSQAWSTFVPGAWQQTMQQNMMNPFATATGAAPAVSVKIASARPVEVITNISSGISHGLDLQELVAEPLRAERSKAAAIEAPEIVREPGKVRVSIKVADKQPAGQYRGVIRKKADGSVAGDLTVIVS